MEKTMLLTSERGVAEMAKPNKSTGGIWHHMGAIVAAVASCFAIITSIWFFIKPAAANMIKEIVSTEIEDASEKITNQITPQLKNLEDDIADIEQDVRQITRDFYKPYGPVFSLDLKPTDEFVTYANISYTTLDGPIKENNTSSLNYDSRVAYSAVANETYYTVEEIADERMLLPYLKGKQEVYFLGQLSENGNWDGNCIINIYEYDKLQLITDALYDDGDLLTCKQVFPYTTTNDKIDVWAVSKLTVKNDFSSGETLYFARETDYKKEFTLDTVEPENIVSVDAFKDLLTGYQECYYFGNISNGRFNDDTSTAYMVKYFPDGTIKTLYVGCFRNGHFHDTTCNAWMIGKEDMGKPYFYYHNGPFENGEPLRDPKLWEKYISQEDINRIIKNYSFNCDLKW